jgi:hypothetical protein
MPHISDPIDLETSHAKPGHILLTRWTWDFYFLIGASAAGFLGSLSWWASGSARHLGHCMLLLGLWLSLRWSWPVQGQPVPSIPRSQRLIPLLTCGLIWFLLLLILGAGLDRLTVPNGQAASAGRSAVRVIAILGLFGSVVGAYFVGRWYRRRGTKGR